MPNLASRRKTIVTGATSIIGNFLLSRLLDAGYEVHAVSPTERENLNKTEEKLAWHQADISRPEQLFSKANSAEAGERHFVAHFAAVEEDISQICAKLEINRTVFRPTLIYDCVRDKNITVIARFIQRYGFFPLLGKASGQCQPAHADDLAAGCVMALNQPATFNKTYNLSGAETLSYRQMVEKLFSALGKSARFLSVPAWLFRWAIRIIALLPGKRNMTPEMAMRMNVDLCFDHANAMRNFGFSPKMFSPCAENLPK